MKCPLCNAEIKEGSLYCEKCGEDIHIVPDYDPVIEDANQTIESISQDIFTEKKEDLQKQPETAGRSEKTEKPGIEDIKPAPRKKRPLLDFPRPFNYIFIAFGFVLIFGLAIAAIVYFTSDKYKMFKADQAYESGEYTKAAFLYEELISKNAYDIELQEKYGEALRGKGDLDNYTALLISIFDNSLGIDWRIPTDKAILSEKDTKHALLKDLDSPFDIKVNLYK